jgi:hypothetical protein
MTRSKWPKTGAKGAILRAMEGNVTKVFVRMATFFAVTLHEARIWNYYGIA